MRCCAKSAGVACIPEQAAGGSGQTQPHGLRATETREVKAWRRKPETHRGKSSALSRKFASIRRGRRNSRSLVLDGLAARGYSSTWRKRGSVQTEDAAGRHRLRAIESSVVRSTSADGSARLKRLDGKPRKRPKDQPDPTDHKAPPATGKSDGCGCLTQEDGGQGALIQPEWNRGNIQTSGCRRLHTA